MPIINSITAFQEDMKKWRQDIHRNPEIGLQEYKTSTYVQARLDEMGIIYHTGFANTGVIGVIKNGTSDRSIGLRADMDALPMPEENDDLPYKSETDGMMHACGHDGHTAILLGTARYLSETKNFDGTVYLYFQPGEEGFAGAQKMMDDGAFLHFKPDAMYGLHNYPGIPVGQVQCYTGALTSNADMFTIKLKGQGTHASQPHTGLDTLLASAYLITQLQTIVSRNLNPFYPAVVSTCQLHSGTAENIIPEYGHVSGTVRTFDAEAQDIIEQRMQDLCDGIEQSYGVSADLTYTRLYPATVNTPDETDYVRQAARDIVGDENLSDAVPSTGGEDFSFFLQKVPGSFFWLGNGDSSGLHTPQYNFNDDALPIGVSIFAKLVESRLAK